MSQISCGIDFGTSNSSLAIATVDNIELIKTENDQHTIPSAMFFLRKGNIPYYGREAMNMFLDKNPGRLMRSLKRVLGNPIMKQGTMVNGEIMKFDMIIASFLKQIKDKADEQVQQNIEYVTMGRPVHFADNNEGADQRAEEELRNIAKQLGFKHISFQYEPIAAAFAHEAKTSGEKLAIVVDLGGGTSDFTVIRLSQKNMGKADRTGDILSNTGVVIGGNDFDKDLSLAAIMPVVGYRSTYGEKNLEVPLKYYHDLSEWSKVNLLYNVKNLSQVKQLLFQSHDKEKFGRLLKILELENGHSLLATTENAKIKLTNLEEFETSFDFVEDDLTKIVSRKEFNDSIANRVNKIRQTALECVELAGIKTEDIDIVILTGGTTEVPMVQEEFSKLFPKAIVSGENKLSSVGLGLAVDSRNRYN